MINLENIKALEFNKIRQEIQKRALGQYSQLKLAQSVPETRLETVRQKQIETAEARLIIDSGQHVPFMGLTQINQLIKKVDQGYVLTPPELIEVADFLRSSRMLQKLFQKNQYQTPLLNSYGHTLGYFVTVEDALYASIKNQGLADEASSQLQKLRRQAKVIEVEIEQKLTQFLRKPQNKVLLQDALIIKKGEHYTIPIKKSYQTKVAGQIIDQSNKGQTVFIEPKLIAKLNERYRTLKNAEMAEEYQILATLTGLLAENQSAIKQSIETITDLDIIFARAKYSREINGITPKINQEERIKIVGGRHPFLNQKAVPLDFDLGNQFRGLVITGANAGGKTVVLKTIGLLILMTMYGLQIPAEPGTEIAIFENLFVDIGDQQDMTNALSTFSGHINNIAAILNQTTRNTLILLDEIGSGTEPNEGAGLAIAIMEKMYQSGALVVATTHYGEIKRFAVQHPDFVPAAMLFDRDTLTPRYQLRIGLTGDSQALWIAKKMQLPEDVITNAAQYIESKEYDIEKQTFDRQVQSAIKIPTVKPVNLRYQKGDRVLLTASQQVGLIYQDNGQDMITAYVNGEMIEVLRRRLKIQGKASELYPENYDLDQLFSDYQSRKTQRDLERGSKKAHRQLLAESQKRRLK